jgi:hypothetical protein
MWNNTRYGATYKIDVYYDKKCKLPVTGAEIGKVEDEGWGKRTVTISGLSSGMSYTFVVYEVATEPGQLDGISDKLTLISAPAKVTKKTKK